MRGAYLRLQNISPEPTEAFRVAPAEWVRVLSEAAAVVHSHPDGNAYPSHADMAGQIASGLPWVITHETGAFGWGGQGRPLLLGRPFRFGVTDCYSLIRDHFALRGIDLPDFPRQWEFWSDGDDIYTEGFPQAGFRVIGEGPEAAWDAKPGDVLLYRLRAKIPNHGAVYLGSNTILHHLASREGYDPTRLSCRMPMRLLAKHLALVLRHAAD